MGQPLRIAPFLGMAPRIAERLLPDGAAVDATNLVLSSGEIRPIKKPLPVTMPGGSGPWFAVYRAEYGGAETWLSWTKDVDVARAPLSSDVEARYYWSGDNEPRFAKFSGLPSTYYSLGIPKPQAAPGVGHSGGVGAATSRVYVYTFFSALGEESSASPPCALTTGKVDGTWAITAMDAFPVSSGAVTGVFGSGVTTFTMAASANHWLRAGEEVTISGTKMAVATAANAFTFTVAGNYAAAIAWTRVAPWNTASMTRRLYRSAGTAATYQLVAYGVGTAYNDTLTDAQILGDELISAGWLLPPVALSGIIDLPNGAMCGFSANLLCFSEPYQPHAWPLDNQYGAAFEIVGIAAFGTTVVAATAGCPYVSAGVDPAATTLEKVDKVWPCLAKRSVASVGDGVVFATAYGMAFVGASGASIMTEPMFSKVEWSPLQPSSMIAAVSEGKVFVRWSGSDGTRGVMVFNGAERVGLTLLLPSNLPDELYSDPRNGKLYIVDNGGISEYDAQVGARLAYSWKSKEYYLPTPTNFGAAKVDLVSEQSQADYDFQVAAYNAIVAANLVLMTPYKGGGGFARPGFNELSINASELGNPSVLDLGIVTFTLYYDNVAVYSKTLAAVSNVLRPPPGKKTSSVAVGLTGTARVKLVVLAETVKGLAVV